MDEGGNIIFTLRLRSNYKTLIEKIEESKNKIVKIFGLFQGYKFNNDYQMQLNDEDNFQFLIK